MHKKIISLIFIVTIILISVIFFTRNSKHVIISDNNLLEYTFKYKNLEEINKTLVKQKYTFSKYGTNKIVSIICLDGKKAKVNEYNMTNESAIDIIVPQNTDFIISLPYNITVTYTWNIKNDIEDTPIKLISKSRIRLSSPNIKKVDGSGYGREDFYFHASDKGNQKICFRFEHEKGITPQYFEANINISIN